MIWAGLSYYHFRCSLCALSILLILVVIFSEFVKKLKLFALRWVYLQRAAERSITNIKYSTLHYLNSILGLLFYSIKPSCIETNPLFVSQWCFYMISPNFIFCDYNTRSCIPDYYITYNQCHLYGSGCNGTNFFFHALCNKIYNKKHSLILRVAES